MILEYELKPLPFGTSGRRGLVVHLTQLEIYTNVTAELAFLQLLAPDQGGIRKGDPFYVAYDLRPSSTAFAPEYGGRGEICQAVIRAVEDSGMRAVNLGPVPTPALSAYAFSRGKGSIMVTGSHIPFDRNGYKLNTSRGELMKEHEAPVQKLVDESRPRVLGSGLFNSRGMLAEGHQELPSVDPAGRAYYLDRYRDFFEPGFLKGKRIAIYQHSAIGRDMLAELLAGFGAEVVPVGRSEEFVPIDTEAIGADLLAQLQAFKDAAGDVDALVSTDGDSDRPLVCGVEAGGKLRFHGGDLVGMVVAEWLGADAIVVPVSCNDAIARGPLSRFLEPQTRIGSPFVIQGMDQALRKGRRRVCGWEANGGFLTGSPIERSGRTLAPLPTRDAMLPVLAVLAASVEEQVPVTELFARLPRRFSSADRLQDFPRASSGRIMEHFQSVKTELEAVFQAGLGFGPVQTIDFTDGVRIRFGNGDVAHFRPSGNADEFRIYAVADTEERAEEIRALAMGGAGLLRQLEAAVKAPSK
ncbi:MAG: phosphomannomutase [Acidobacteria bacterium]|nr:phosphomannomutase [Acidobacteriota bacterium]